MKFTAARSSLVDALSLAASVAERKPTMPALSCVLLTVGADLRIQATDLKLAVSTRADVEHAAAGVVAVNARDLLERIKAMPDGPIAVSLKDDTLTIKAASRKYTLPTMPAADFPELPAPPAGAHTLTVDLGKLIERTAFSICDDVTRPHLNSALFEWDGSTVRMVSTDGHRLSRYETTVDGTATASLLLPQTSIAALRKLEGPVAITQSGNQAHFECDGVALSTMLTDAQFPPYQQVIPERRATTVNVAREEFVDAIRAVKIASGDSGVVKLTISDGVGVSVEANGSASDEMVATVSGPGLKIGLNGQYLIDALQACESEMVEIDFGGELDPVVVYDGGYLGVMMPMRI